MAPSSRLHPAFRQMRKSVLAGRLLRPGDSVLVACSGGPDSVALLHLLLELSRDIPFSVSVAHFNHQLRPLAAADERFVQDMVLALDLPLYAGRADVRAAARKMGLGIEETGRSLRYEFLERAAAEAGASKIATGHHRDDQAETVLMRLLTSATPWSLRAMAEREGRLARPLLRVWRQATLDYCAALGLEPVDDPSNRDPRFLRSRVRHELLPALEGVFPGARRRLATLALRQRDLLEGGGVAGPAVIGNKAVTPRSRLPRSSEPLL